MYRKELHLEELSIKSDWCLGPNELSVVSPDAAVTILEPRSPWISSPRYDYTLYPSLESLRSIRDIVAHKARRRVWDHAFGVRASISPFLAYN